MSDQPGTAAQSPWQDSTLSPDERARLLIAELTLEEKVGLLHSHFAVQPAGSRPEGALGSAAFTPGVTRLGLPAIQETDASLGVAHAHGVRDLEPVTALPSGLALGATFDLDLARRAGAAVGAEARAKGYIVLLAGGANLVREPRGGRSFEYLSEDPLLTGRMAGASIAGIQSARVLSTVKHFAVNPEETGRVVVSSDLPEAALRESDLLAFQVAIEDGQPGSVMTGYNSVNGEQASEHAFLLGQVLKCDWGFAGFTMSDWGGTHSTARAILAGLDRQSGQELDVEVFFGAALLEAVGTGEVPAERVDDAVRRLLRSLIAVDWLDDPPWPGGAVDYSAHGDLAQEAAGAGIVLLANDGVLPLVPGLRRVAVIGAMADSGVLSGGGSSQVAPPGSLFSPSPEWSQGDSPRVHHPSSPLAALRAALPSTEVVYHDGVDHAAAAELAATVDVAVVVVEQWTTESADVLSLSLPDGQDGLVSVVATAAPSTVVVLITGGPVLMPWAGDVAAVVAAWYPGGHGAEALAAILTGQVNPSGRLPVSFPGGTAELPRPQMRDPATTQNHPGQTRFGAFSVDYDIEGSDVGYRWYAKTSTGPAYPFGHGLGYTTFAYSDLAVTVLDDITVAFDVTNTGTVPGADVPQVYVKLPGGSAPRLAGWERLTLEPGERRRVALVLEPRILADYDTSLPGWRTPAGKHRISLRRNAEAVVLQADVELAERRRQP